MTNGNQISEAEHRSCASRPGQTKVDLSHRSNAKANSSSDVSSAIPRVALLTGGGDKPYALGLAEALSSNGMELDFIGSNDVDAPELHNNPHVNFLNLRGDQRPDAGAVTKAFRVLRYYQKLIRYAATAKPRIFHILWNNKFELVDRTVLMLFYKLLRKKVVFTAHNVNAGKRDSNDSFLNRLTLKIQYRLADHIFVHTRAMKSELMADFIVPDHQISVIPFGINNSVPNTALTPAGAKQQLGIKSGDQVLLFFGNIASYKGLEYLIEAFEMVARTDENLRLLVAGRSKESENYWSGLLAKINRCAARTRMVLKIEYVPDEDTELYFKAADVLVLPYTRVFQSGVLFLGYSFGLPVIAADVGSLKEEIIEGKTGFVFKAMDSLALAKAIEGYFSSDLYKNLENRRQEIREYANEHHSWAKAAAITTKVYQDMLEN